MKELFVFDFDGTIVSGHTHNAITKAKREAANPENVDAWETVKNFPIIGSPDDWKNIFKTLNQRKHCVAIASFNAYDSVILEFLKKIGLTEEVIGQIHIIAEFPADPKTANKNEYIQQAIAKAQKEGFSGDPEDVLLIDDSKKNINAANEKGYQVIHAKKDGSHLTELQKKLEEKSPVVDRNAKPKQLSESEQLKQKIETIENQREALENQRKEHLQTINELKSKKKLSEENSTILHSELKAMELASKEKYDYSLKLKKQLDVLVVDLSNKSKHVVPILKSTEEQGVVSTEVTKQSPQPTLLGQKLNFSELMEAKKEKIIKFWNTPLEEINKTPTTVKQPQQISDTPPAVDRKLKKEVIHESDSARSIEPTRQEKELNELLKAKPKKLQQLTPVVAAGLFNELKAKQASRASDKPKEIERKQFSQ